MKVRYVRSKFALLLIVVASYGLVVSIALLHRPLWVDEVLQLLGTRDRSFPELLHWAAANPGGVPLGYITQWAFLRALGYSLISARLPAALFGVLSLIAVGLLAKQLGLASNVLAVALFAALPLPLRYALEARPYSQALFFSLVATASVVELSRRPSLGPWLVYTFALTAALYTQPFSFFLCTGHLAWVAGHPAHTRQRLTWMVCMAAGLALLCFAPWYLAVRPSWRAAVVREGYSFCFSAKSPLLLIREFCGAGYAGSLLLFAAMFRGWRSRRLSAPARALLAASTLLPLLCVVAADAAFHYFLAVRQIFFVLPAATLLAAEGLRMPHAALLFSVAAVADCSALARPREDWARASLVLRESLPEEGCIAVAPAESLSLYAFFEPSLAGRACSQKSHPQVVVAITPYTQAPAISRLYERLLAAGYTFGDTHTVGGTRIVIASPPLAPLPEDPAPAGLPHPGKLLEFDGMSVQESSHPYPKVHNAMWPGLVGKGPDSEPPIDLDTMLRLTAAARINGAGFDGVDLFLFDPHVSIDSSHDDLARLADKIRGLGLVIGSVVAPVWAPTGGGSAMGSAEDRERFVEQVHKACHIACTLRDMGIRPYGVVRIDSAASVSDWAADPAANTKRIAETFREACEIAEDHGERLAAEGEICWGGMHSWKTMLQLLELVDRPKTLGFQADMAHTLLFTLGYNEPEDRILPPDFQWDSREALESALRTLTAALRPWTIDFHIAQNDATVKGSGSHDKTGHHCLPHDPAGKLDIVHDAGYWMRDESGEPTRAFTHICWDGCMFPNAVMLEQQTWNDILGVMLDVRNAHGWNQ